MTLIGWCCFALGVIVIASALSAWVTAPLRKHMRKTK